jgi:PAS domain S-box-containing protein
VLGLPKSLRSRLVLLVLAATLPLAGMAVFKAVQDSGAAIQRATDQLEFAAALVAAVQERNTVSARQLLHAISEAPGLLSSTDADCERYFKLLNDQLPGFANFGLAGVDGKTRCHGFDGPSGVDINGTYIFTQALARKDFVVGAHVIGRITRMPVVPFSLPVLGADKSVLAVVFASLDLAEFARTLANVPLPGGSQLVVTDRDGVVVAAQPTEAAVVGQPVHGGAIRRAFRPGSPNAGSQPPDAGEEARIVAFHSAGPKQAPDFFVAVSMDRERVLAPGRALLAQQLGALAIVAALGAWLAWLIGGRAIVRPAQEIVNAARQMQSARLGARVPALPAGASAELVAIAESFNQMAHGLQLREHALEAELARSRRIQRKLIDAQRLGRIGNWELDLPGHYLWWSEEVESMFGLEPGQFDGRPETMVSMIHPDDRARYVEARDQAIRRGSELDIEYVIVTPSGELRWLHQIGRLQHDEVGLPVCRTGVVQDITARKVSELALADSNELLRRIGEMARIGGWRLELASMQLTCSEQFFHIHEVTPGNPFGFAEAVGAYETPARERFEAAVQQAREHGAPWDLELPMTTRRGRAIWVRTQGRAMVENGRIVRLVGALQDITLRKLADQAAAEAEQRYSALFANAPVPMWVFDSDSFRFLTVNHAALKTYGFSREEFLDGTLYDIRPPSEHETLRRHINTPGEADRSWVHRRKDGSTFPVKVVSQPVQYGGRTARFAVVLDLTAQRAAEEAMQQHLFTLQRASDAAQAITWHRELGGMLQEVADQVRGVIGTHQSLVMLARGSDAATPLQALSVSEHLAAGWAGVDLDALRCLLGPVLDSNRAMRLTHEQVEVLRGRSAIESAEASPPDEAAADDDTTAPFGARARCAVPAMSGCLAVPLMGRSGNNIGILQMADKYEGQFSQQDEYVAMELARLVSVAIENAQLLGELNQLTVNLEQTVRDRTDALTRQEALFRALAEQAPQVVWTVDVNAEATFFNRAWFDLMGGDLADWSGYKWFDAIHPDDLAEVKANWARAKAERTQFGGIRRIIAKDRSVHTMSYRSSPVLDEQGEVAFWVGIDADITEIKAIESALRLSNQELEAFSYSVSHDLRSPLNTIDGFSRLLAKQIDGESGEKARHYLSRIHAGVAQMGQLIEDLLSLAQVSRAQLRHEQIDLSAMAGQIFENLRAASPDRQVEIHIEDGLRADGDARLVRVVMENLIGNAWKFSSHRERADITVGCSPNSPGSAAQPVFFVRDNGAGFDMAYADKLFRAFQRLHTATEFPGTGIGLATVKRIVERHGGQLWPESAPDQGATFYFTLPRPTSASTARTDDESPA